MTSKMHSAKSSAKRKDGKRIEDWGLRIIVRIIVRFFSRERGFLGEERLRFYSKKGICFMVKILK